MKSPACRRPSFLRFNLIIASAPRMRHARLCFLSKSSILSTYPYLEMIGFMEKLYVNGSIHTLDAASPLVSALAAVDGRIVAIGTEAEVRAAVSPAAEVVDLGGRTVTPAFSDTHLHLLSYVGSKRAVDLSPVHSVEELIAACRAALAAGQLANGWLMGLSLIHIYQPLGNSPPQRNPPGANAAQRADRGRIHRPRGNARSQMCIRDRL